MVLELSWVRRFWVDKTAIMINSRLISHYVLEKKIKFWNIAKSSHEKKFILFRANVK